MNNAKKEEYTYTEDTYIKKMSNVNQELALELALKRFTLNKGKDLGDYKQLMYIYIDMGEYGKVINLGKTALFLMSKFKIKEIGIHAILSKMVQAYLFDGQVLEAELIFKKYSYIEMFFERFILEYKKENYDYLIENYEKIKKDKRHYIGPELYLLAMAYIKKEDINNAINIFEELYEYGIFIEKEQSLLGTYYIYMSSINLKELYLELKNNIKSDFYNTKFILYKNRIENEGKIENTEDNIELYYNSKLIYFNINRISNLI